MTNYHKTNEYDVIVIGAGIMGSATAYFLTKSFEPSKILLLEQFDWLHRKGSSHGESRIIRRTYPEDYYACLMNDAYKLWAEAEVEAGTKVFTQTGGVDFGAKNNPAMHDLIAAAQKYHVSHEVWTSPSEVKRKFPMMKLPENQLAVYSPDSGILNATKAVGMFQNLTKLNGGQILDNMPVENIVKVNPGVYKITTQGGHAFYTKKCIITAGAWTGKLVQKFFNIELPLQPHQATIAYWQVSSPELYASKQFPVFINYDEDASTYGTPAHEYSNMIKCSLHHGTKCDPDKRTFEPAMGPIKNEVNNFLQAHFIGVSLEPTFTETCMYTLTPDEDFIIDLLPNYSNVIIGCGFSGTGFKLGPVVGKMLCQLAIDGGALYPSAMKAFSLARFNIKP